MRVKPVIYEWAADHFKWVQYPESRQRASIIERRVPISTRMVIGVASLCLLVISTIMLFVLCYLVFLVVF